MGSSKLKNDDGDGEIKLKKEIGIIQGVSIVSGIIIGSGIFLSPVGVLEHAGSVGLSLIIWAVNGLFSTLGAMVYAELGVTIPKSGGEYSYILEIFGPLLAFLALWITFVVIGAASLAVNSLTFAEYILKTFRLDCEVPYLAIICLAYFGILILGFVNSYNVKWATWVSMASTFSKFAALLMIFGLGIHAAVTSGTQNFENAFEGSTTNPGEWALSFYQGFWAFSGWNYLNFLIGEVKNPARNVPIIIILSMTLVTTVYLLANIAYFVVLSPQQMLAVTSGGSAIGLTFARMAIPKFYWIMPVFVGASVFGSMNGEILSMSRLAFTASEEGHMPSILSMVHIHWLTPLPAVLCLISLGLGFTLYNNVGYLIELAGLSFTVISGMAVLSLIYIKIQHPEMNQSKFKLPMFMPVLYMLFNSAIGILTIYQTPKESMISLGLMATAIPVYIFGVMWKKPKEIQNKLVTFQRFLQRLTYSVPQQASSSAKLRQGSDDDYEESSCHDILRRNGSETTSL